MGQNESDIVFEGVTGVYRQIDLSKAPGDTSYLIPFDSDLASLGFTLVGDLMSSMLNGFLRCYGNASAQTRSVLSVAARDNKLNVVCLIFESNFGDDVSLTTTTSPAMKDKPEKGMIRRLHQWRGVHDLFQKHQNHMSELKLKYGEPQAIGVTLLSLAESIDFATVKDEEDFSALRS